MTSRSSLDLDRLFARSSDLRGDLWVKNAVSLQTILALTVRLPSVIPERGEPTGWTTSVGEVWHVRIQP